MNFITKLENIIPSLPKQERKAALFIIQEPKKAQKLNITDLAKAAEVSNATITRLTRKLNCKNFAELKLNLASLDTPHSSSIDTKDKTLYEVYDFYNRVLKENWQKINIEQLKKVIKLIQISKRIYIFGIGSSGFTAQEMNQRLLRMGISTFAITESSSMYMSSSIMDSDDLIIAISSSGNTDEINSSVELGKKMGATVVGITGFSDSTLAKIVDIPIVVRNTNFMNDARFVNSQFSIMYVIDLITTLLLKNENYRQRMSHTINMVLNRKLNK
ncbi:MurR/RpiR family transcriptional regulator [Lactobacillus sp. LL6]|uniref:MurR/RpiR family transcriptional regulator n=1 Tax=Lactobacillus sp. LL6 TaxID=2596827 RepID=UPI0011851FAC|nr:MurR/RpiR family transcriptional regulator [Lactobacillus sp. LL6]TSO25454.1 MurR/RpiR family transcriptional regulator [Lactobacillus sp. LL6]